MYELPNIKQPPPTAEEGAHILAEIFLAMGLEATKCIINPKEPTNG
jgi:hypothetical protein